MRMGNLRWEHAPTALSPFSSILFCQCTNLMQAIWCTKRLKRIGISEYIGMVCDVFWHWAVWFWVHESHECMTITMPFELIWASVSISLGAMRREKSFPRNQCFVSHIMRRGVAREADPGVTCISCKAVRLWLHTMEFLKRLLQSCQLKKID